MASLVVPKNEYIFGYPIDFSKELSSLAGWWPLNEGIGDTARDISGNNNDGTLVSNVTWDQSERGACLSFPGGTGNNVNCGNHANLRQKDVTISMWINITSYPGAGTGADAIMSFVAPTELEEDNVQYTLFFNGNSNGDIGQISYIHEYGAGLNADTIHEFTSYTFSIGQWYHVVFVRNDNPKTVKLYADGVFREEFTYGHSPTGGSTASLYIGMDGATSQGSFNGLIRDVRIYNKPLPSEGVQGLFLGKQPFKEVNPDIFSVSFANLVSIFYHHRQQQRMS